MARPPRLRQADAPPAPGPDHRSVSWPVLLAYAAPLSGVAFYLFFVQFYFLKFATDVLLLPPAISLLFGAGRIWDAISDPLAGYWSDRTRTRWGRRRPWMLAGIPLLAVFSVMIWSPPSALGERELILWSALALFGFYTAYTVYSVPHQSFGAELSLHHHERSRVFGAHRMCFMVGMALAFAGIHYVSIAGDPRAAAVRLALGTAVAASVLLLLPPVILRERAAYQGRGATSPYAALRDVLHNPHARILLMTWFVEGFGGGVLGVTAPFLSVYVVKRPDLVAVLPAVFMAAAIASIPVWIRLSRRFGKRNVWMVAIAGHGAFFGATFFVQEHQLSLLFALLFGAGAATGCGGAIGASMLADVIDYDELRSGERKEGAYSAAWGFALKLSIGIVIAVTGVVLQIAGFQPNVEQTRSAELALRGLFAGVPAAAACAALLTLRRFSLDEREHGRIRAALAARG
jgi:GPH family glycoside/pentoside/hexuronide:cation symporter